MKEFYFLLLLSALAVVAVKANHDNDQCSNEAAVNLSRLQGLYFHRMEMLERVHSLNETINQTMDVVERVEKEIDSVARPDECTDTCRLPRDCCEIKRMYPLAKSGLYTIRHPQVRNKLFTTARLTVYCDMETDGGGWIVIQRRNASARRVDFTRKWTEYEKGFGDVDGEFWIGLRNIYDFANGVKDGLYLQFAAWNETLRVKWTYKHFNISDVDGPFINYKGRFPYTITNLSYACNATGFVPPFHFKVNRHPIRYFFQTYDRPHVFVTNCPFKRKSAWWYHYDICGERINFNGKHESFDLPGTNYAVERIYWSTTSYTIIRFPNTEIRIRPDICKLTTCEN